MQESRYLATSHKFVRAIVGSTTAECDPSICHRIEAGFVDRAIIVGEPINRRIRQARGSLQEGPHLRPRHGLVRTEERPIRVAPQSDASLGERVDVLGMHAGNVRETIAAYQRKSNARTRRVAICARVSESSGQNR